MKDPATITHITVRTADGATDQFDKPKVSFGEDGVHIEAKAGHVFYPWVGVVKLVIQDSSR